MKKAIFCLWGIAVVLFLQFCSPKTEPVTIIRTVKANTQLNVSERPADFSPYYLFDGDGATSWCEGEEKNGDNSMVTVALTKPIQFNRLWLQNGFKSGVIKQEKNAQVPDEKTSFANYNSRAAAQALRIQVKLKGKPKGEVLVKDIPDKPASTLALSETLLGDEITIQLVDFHITGRGYMKHDTCLTDIAFGLSDKKGEIKFPTKFFYKDGIEKEWADYYKLVLEEDYRYLSNNAWFAKCISQPTDCQGYSRVMISDISDNSKRFAFIWERPDVQAISGTVVFLEVTEEQEEAESTNYYFYRLKASMHTVDSGLEYDVLEPAGEELVGRMRIRWVKDTELPLHQLADDPQKTKYHYLMEVTSEISNEEPLQVNYILSKTK